VQRQMLGFEEAQQDWRQIFTLLKNFGYDGTVSLHSEYGDLNRDGLVEQTRRDLTFIKRIVTDVEAG
jgi:sugar phosphate isomerase/epimerase